MVGVLWWGVGGGGGWWVVWWGVGGLGVVCVGGGGCGWGCGVVCLCVFFFFSSRRRHTRCLSDWSSDVCSSDLGDVHVDGVARHELHVDDRRGVVAGVLAREERVGEDRRAQLVVGMVVSAPHALRSEERRVGKECRSQRAGEHEKRRRDEERQRE